MGIGHGAWWGSSTERLVLSEVEVSRSIGHWALGIESLPSPQSPVPSP